MEITYLECKNENNEIACILRSDGWSIPTDPANSDYQAYLAYLASQENN